MRKNVRGGDTQRVRLNERRKKKKGLRWGWGQREGEGRVGGIRKKDAGRDGDQRERWGTEGNQRGPDKEEEEMDRGRNAHMKAEAGTGAREPRGPGFGAAHPGWSAGDQHLPCTGVNREEPALWGRPGLG